MMKFVLLVALAAVSYGANIPEDQISKIEEHIVGGKNTDISEVPYQIAMYKGGRFMCGGSIISQTMIVTAAHCVWGQSASQITIRAGSSNPNGGGVVVRAKRLMAHSYHNSNTMDYDVGLIELAEPLSFSNTIRAISLGGAEPGDGSQVKVSGFGLLRENGQLATTLQSVVVPVVNKGTCANFLSKYLKVTPRMLCAGVEGRDACLGDSGGPLTSGGQLVGIVSFGVGCARRNLPGVYTSVANPEINSWIRQYGNL